MSVLSWTVSALAWMVTIFMLPIAIIQGFIDGMADGIRDEESVPRSSSG